MKRFTIFIGLLFSCLAVLASPTRLTAQEAEKKAPPAEATAKVDQVSQQASSLEAELGKFKDTSPQAADVLVELAELYHTNGRVFGLIRAARRFMTAHVADPRHEAMMLKLIDGLEAAARGEDLITACRQFLERYPKSKSARNVEERLVQHLDRQGKTAEAGQAYQAAWQRSPTADSFSFAMTGAKRYLSINDGKLWRGAAVLAEEVFDKAPKGALAEYAGWESFHAWRRASEWAKANVIGGKMLKAGYPSQAGMKWNLHRSMAENYASLGQHANSAEAYRQARALRDDATLHHQQILQIYNAGAKPEELKPLVDQYVQKYPQRDDRYFLQSYLAQAHFRAGDTPGGIQLVRALLPHDAATHSQAYTFVRNTGAEPAQLADTERVMLDAIAKNPRDAQLLRFVLAFELYRDRMKDLDKTRKTLRDLIRLNPGNDNHTYNAVDWLLGNAANDAEFNADVAMIVKARQDNLHLRGFASRLGNWISSARAQAKKDKDEVLKARVARAAAALQAGTSEFAAGWLKIDSPWNKNASKFRSDAITDGTVDKLPDAVAEAVLGEESYYLRHQAPGNQRGESVAVFEKMTQRFPKDVSVAYRLVEAAYHYGTTTQAHDAVRHFLSIADTYNDSTAWYYLLLAADRSLNKEGDTDEVKQANWEKSKELVIPIVALIRKTQEQHGQRSDRASLVGDMLAKYGQEADALAWWKSKATSTDFYTGDDSETYACALRVAARLEGAQKVAYLNPLIALDSYYYGGYVQALAAHYLAAGDIAAFEKTLTAARDHQIVRGTLGQGFDEGTLSGFISSFGVTEQNPREVTDEEKQSVYQAVANLRYYHSSALAELKLLAALPDDALTPIERLLRYHRASLIAGNAHHYWDQVLPYANELLAEQDYLAAATLVTGMLENIPNIDESRRARGRQIVAQSYSRIGAVGLTIDETSPTAPLLQAALMLRLGDRRLAFEAYTAHQALFDAHRDELPADFILFVCENHMAAGGDENFDRVEDILRGWIVKFSESNQHDERTKAQVQLLLARNYFKARRFDIARSEFTTVKNRYPDTREALEAEFGIGETYMSQKVYDQAEAVFDKLTDSSDNDVVIRAQFLRGVLAYRKGEIDEARAIFRTVLERVPDEDLANHTLFELARVYEFEERFTDQLSLLRTVGRLGRHSKRWHRPGDDLSIVVQDNDLGISRGHSKIPVNIHTEPGGDEETIYLTSGGAGKGLFRADLRTRLGAVVKGDNILQVSGQDVIRADYPEQFKADFKHVPLSDVDIEIAANAEFNVASSLIEDEEEKSFSDTLREQAEQEELDQRVSQQRPANQIKPGNLVYLRVKDPDRDLTDQPDEVVVKLTAQSGDEVQVVLKESGEHTGIFTGTAQTGELPAGAIATDSAIEHSPLMAIDRDPATYWLSEPDGATPKELTIDMKDLRLVSRVRISTPDPDVQAPVRGDLMGSNDGRFWFRIASNPPDAPLTPIEGEYGAMQRRVYAGNYTNLTTWEQIVNVSKNATPVSTEEVQEIHWALAEDDENAEKSHAVLWHGKFVQPRPGAIRFGVQGATTALAMDGRIELPLAPGNRTVDVWLEPGLHDLTIFATTNNPVQGVSATRAHANLKASSVVLTPLKAEELDVEQATATLGTVTDAARPVPQVLAADGDWEFRFAPIDVRFVRLVVNEYLGDAVAIGNVQVRGDDDDLLYIPTEADVLALANNDVLEIAGGDVVTAAYTDERTQSESGASRLLTAELMATYFDANIATIAYDFIKNSNGTVSTVAKDLMRIDPGERFIVEIVDYDKDQTDQPDTLRFQVMVNDGEPLDLTATETEPYSGVFTKEVDTSATPETGKLAIKAGDRIYCRYIDSQNTFPGHSVPRETVLYVRHPTQGQVRIVETRFTPPDLESETPGRVTFLPPADDVAVAGVAFEVPLTVEVIDPDAAKDSRSTIDVALTTTEGAKVEVECKISDAFRGQTYGYGGQAQNSALAALEQGRFVGQIILQLGGKNSPDIVPLSADMPRNLIGGGKLPEEQRTGAEALIIRVLNVTGQDLITAEYQDEMRPGGSANIAAQGRLITNGQLRSTDRDYNKDVAQLHVGEKLFILVSDADQDKTDERDTVTVEITTKFGEKEMIQLEETLAHSGVFSGSLTLKANDQPTPGNLSADDPVLESYFGDVVYLKYVDTASATESGQLELDLELPVVIGTDGLLAAFSKAFTDEKLAVETKFHIAESYFELFKSHKDLGRDEEQTTDLESGKRILREVMEDYPDPKYVPRIAYLLGQFAQELGHYDEAIASYEQIVRQYPNDLLAPDAQYKLAQCYEEAGDFDEALEAYVTLAATYPKSPLIANVMIRISDYFYKHDNFEVAAQVGEKFLDKFPSHQHAPRIAFRVGQAYYKGEIPAKASDAFDRFVKKFPDDALAADALFWAGESFRVANNAREAFRRYNRCRWDFPASEAAKYARGRLTLPEMLNQFEQEAAALENDQ